MENSVQIIRLASSHDSCFVNRNLSGAGLFSFNNFQLMNVTESSIVRRVSLALYPTDDTIRHYNDLIGGVL